MNIELKRGRVKAVERTEFYFIGMNYYDEFDWFLDFLLKRNDTRLIEKIDGIFSRIARLESQGVLYEVIHHDDIGYYAHVTEKETDENLSRIERIFRELTEQIKEF